LLQPARRDSDLEEELRLHLEMAEEDARRRGLRGVDTARKSRLTAGGMSQAMEALRDQRGVPWLADLARDGRHGLRTLRRSPGFTAVALMTLALGIGANSAIFALADATLLRPLPYPDADRLVMIWERSATNVRSSISLVNLHDWEERSRSFDAMAAIALGLGGGPLLEDADGAVDTVDRQSVSARFFDTLGVIPVAGRVFLPADERSAANVLILTEGLWRSRFGGDVTVIGRDVSLSGQPYTIIGVVPDHVRLSRPASVWTLLPSTAVNQRGLRFSQGVGRLKRGVSLESAQAELSNIAAQLAREYPDTNRNRGITLEPLRAGIMGRDLQVTSLLLLGVVGFVLIMCCGNVANLLLARATVRAREFAVRSALGAGRGRLIRQLLTESLTLGAFGGLLGIGVGAAILRVAPAVLPAGLLPATIRLALDARVVTFCVVTALAVGLLFGIMPALQATRTSLVQALASAGRTSTRAGGRVRSLLAAGQIASAVLLLCGAGLLLRTLWVLGNFDAGYGVDDKSVVTLDFSVPRARYPTRERLVQFYEDMTREVTAIPNVRSAGWSTSLPFGNVELGRWPFEIVGGPPTDADRRPVAEYTVASPGYFDTLDIPIVAGRGFTEHDSLGTPAVCVVNEAFVRRHLAGRNPLGAWLSIRSVLASTPDVREIVGVVRQVKGRPDAQQELLQVYVPLTQVPYDDIYLAVRAGHGPPEALVPAIRSVVARQDANVSVRRIRTLEDLATEATIRYRFRAVTVGTFAGIALVLALAGVFSVLSYAVEQRRREFGVRVALGASPARLLRSVLGSATRVVTGGVLVGVVLSAVLSRWIAGFLFGITPLDPITFGAVVAVLALTGVLATLAPALRAARVDPVIAFRIDQ